jgi:hypothetical protein
MANIGSPDRIVRIVLGIVLLLAPFVAPSAAVLAGLGAWKYAMVAVGAILVVTGLLRFCPLYRILGIRSC